MKITEIFDSKLDLEWKKQGRYLLAAFDVGGIEYVVQIEHKPILKIPELEGKKTAEISFFANTIDNIDSHSTQYKFGADASKVYGVVFNALNVMFAQYDAFYFIASVKHSTNNKELEQKSKIYLALANSVSKRYNAKIYDQKTKYGNAFLVSKIDIENNVDFINETVEFRKTIDWDSVPKI